jgi:hypothetical protein
MDMNKTEMINRMVKELREKGLDVSLQNSTICFSDESRITFMENMQEVLDEEGLALDFFLQPSSDVYADEEISVAKKMVKASTRLFKKGKIVVYANIWDRWDEAELTEEGVFALIRSTLKPFDNFYLITDSADTAEMESEEFRCSFGVGSTPNIYFNLKGESNYGNLQSN